MTPDGMETRSENIGDSGRIDFSRRATVARETSPAHRPDTMSIREAIIQHREQARVTAGQTDPAAGIDANPDIEDHSLDGSPLHLLRGTRSSTGDTESHAQRRFRSDTARPGMTDPAPVADPPTPTPNEPAQRKPSRLRFEETSPPSGSQPPSNKLSAARAKADRSADRLEEAKSKLPQKRRVRVVKTNAHSKPGRMLRFEKEVKTQREHLKGPVITRPAKAGVKSAAAFGHRKIYQAEQENVGVQAAHRGEMAAE